MQRFRRSEHWLDLSKTHLAGPKKYGRQHDVVSTVQVLLFKIFSVYIISFGRYSLPRKELKFSAYSIYLLFTHTCTHARTHTYIIPYGVCSFHRFNESHFNLPYRLSLLEQQLKPLFPRSTRIFMKNHFSFRFCLRRGMRRIPTEFFRT